ncbi:glycosyltransferase [Pseudonocardia xinjiangensis]|uniref:glycosyltransferase n=1 Tax=Pseudonocardia xinjiangensis TaxID=75289 RepID=UPI001B7D1E61|nr:glycosyltransferase [Pseudonocardia xinjiangensis]
MAQALRAAGHEVAVATGPALTDDVHRAGLRHLVMPRMLGPEELMADPELARRIGLDRELAPSPDAVPMEPGEAFGRLFAGLIAVRAAEDMLEAARGFRPDLVVREATEFGGHLTAAVLGVPCATLDIAPLAGVRHPGMVPVLNGSRAVFGLPPLDGLAGLLPEPWISWLPESWYPDDIRATVRSYRAPDAAPEVLDPAIVALPVDRPLVLAALGSSTGVALAPEASPLPRIVEALGTVPCTAVVALGRGLDPSDWTGPRPANVHLTSFVQQRLLLPACDLFLTHAGLNSVREALAAGVPMVAVPLFAEQPANAERLAEAGVAVALDPTGVDASTVAAACREVLEDTSFHLAARGFQRRILGLPGVDRLVADLTALVA